MKVKIKKLNKDAVIPKYAKDGDAGMDLTAVSCDYDKKNDVYVYGTGLCFEIPKGYVGEVYSRSSIYKTGLILSNGTGVIDSGYRGEVLLKFYNSKDDDKSIYKKGDRIGQIIIMPYPKIEFEEVKILSDSERGSGGYGSSGR
ncbi:dUTP diphosphatase [uncultured Mediterranean phage uvMED]|nr:dUTP diphosphatase [uncultured Mediterranean phage uvMED]